MDAPVGTGAAERRGDDRREEKRTREDSREKDSSEVGDGSPGCHKAMSKNSSHQAAR